MMFSGCRYSSLFDRIQYRIWRSSHRYGLAIQRLGVIHLEEIPYVEANVRDLLGEHEERNQARERTYCMATSARREN
jgi:hypothetical protein